MGYYTPSSHSCLFYKGFRVLMTDQWQSVLDKHGAVRDEQGVRNFKTPGAKSQDCNLFVLDHLGCLLVSGPDARKFLQGQVTCDMNQLSPTQSLTGGHCNLKGRLLFSFRAILLGSNENGDQIALLMHRGLLKAAQQALAKFIVFSKATLSQGSDFRVLGLAGSSVRSMLPELPASDGNAIQHESGSVIRIADERFLFLAQEEAAIQFFQQNAEACQLHGYEEWNLSEIRSGLGHVVPGTEDMFIPQMLNMQITGGVSFTKGCYVGQEVVARMQYLGKLKRHMRRLALASNNLPLPGTPLYTEGSSQSVGNVVLAAPAGDQVELLAVVTDDAFGKDSLYLDQDGQQKLARLELPYSIE